MSRGSCQVCNHTQRSEIDAALSSGQKLRDLAETFHVSAASLSRHRARHINMPASEESADELAGEIAKWCNRADQIWVQAEVDSDTRGLVQACQAGLRALEFAQRTQDKRDQRDSEQREKETSAHSPVTIASLDGLVRAAETQARQNPIPHLIRLVESELSLLAEHQRSVAKQGLREYLNGGMKAA